MRNKFIKLSMVAMTLLSGGLSLSSCNSNSKAFITFGTYIDSEVREFSTFEYMRDLMDLSKESFLVTVYPENGCSCWVEFKAILNKFTQEKHVLSYSISENLIKALDQKDRKGFTYSDSAPVFFIVKDGVIYQKIEYYTGSTTPFAHYNQFVKLYEQYCEYPTIKLVDAAYFTQHKDDETDLMLHIYRTTCPDCQSALSTTLAPKNKEKKYTTTTWAIDCQDFYQDDVVYTAFKNAMCMTPATSEDFGYANGRVPTTQYYHNGVLTDANVYYNDFVDKNKDNEFYISDSFFSQDRLSKIKYSDLVLTGLKVPAEYVIEYQSKYYLNSDFVYPQHKKALESFINMYAYK